MKCRSTERGFTLADIIVVVGVIGVISAIAIPSIGGSVARLRLAQATREVERELQTAKQRSVGKSRPIRVRFNCPGANQYRIVELIGSPAAPVTADSATDRCSESMYPFPAGDTDPMTRPNLDGPLRQLESSTSFGAAQTIEFWPNGTAHYANGSGDPWPVIPTTGIPVTLTRYGRSITITVNGLGKIQLQSE